MNKLALMLSIISSPDVQEFDTSYTGRCSYFVANHASALNTHYKTPTAPYVACRWKYDKLAREAGIQRNQIKSFLNQRCVVKVLNPVNGREIEATPIDWGPARKTGRAIDMDKSSLEILGANTDDKLIFELRRVR